MRASFSLSFSLQHRVAMAAIADDGLDGNRHHGGPLSSAERPAPRGVDAPNTRAPSPMPVARDALTVVLDTNVWIDILVYNDPVSRPIRAALESGRLDAVIDTACLYELNRVLDYPQFARFAIDKAAAIATTLALTRQLNAQPDEGVAAALPGADTTIAAHVAHAPVLPRCSDRDDQKFLELAAAGNARWLVTKDKALLKLAKRLARDFDCRIDRPVGFVSAVLPTARSD